MNKFIELIKKTQLYQVIGGIALIVLFGEIVLSFTN